MLILWVIIISTMSLVICCSFHQVHWLNVTKLDDEPRLVRPMQLGVWYYIEHAQNRFYILSNVKNGDEFVVMGNIVRSERVSCLMICWKTGDGGRWQWSTDMDTILLTWCKREHLKKWGCQCLNIFSPLSPSPPLSLTLSLSLSLFLSLFLSLSLSVSMICFLHEKKLWLFWHA